MNSPTKLSQEELNLLHESRQNNKAVVNELGQISILEENLKNRKDNALKYLEQLRLKETELAKALEDKYGKGTVDIDTGIFIPTN